MSKQFGFTLKRLREGKNLSQSKLADLADFDHSYVSRLENDSREPSRDAVNRLADAMHLDAVDRDTLLAAACYSPSGSVLHTDPDLLHLAALLHDPRINAGDRERLRYAVRALSQLITPPAAPVMGMVA